MPNNDGNNTDLTSAEILWKLADALRGPIDVAGYKHVVCGMVSEKIQGLIDVISDIGPMGDSAKGREAFGRVLAYFLGKFSQVERKLGSECFAPRRIVRALVEMLGPYEGRYYYPSGGSSGMFMQAECLVEAHGKENTNASIYCQ